MGERCGRYVNGYTCPLPDGHVAPCLGLHLYTVDSFVHGASPCPCIICGHGRQHALHQVQDGGDGSAVPS